METIGGKVVHTEKNKPDNNVQILGVYQHHHLEFFPGLNIFFKNYPCLSVFKKLNEVSQTEPQSSNVLKILEILDCRCKYV